LTVAGNAGKEQLEDLSLPIINSGSNYV